MSAPDTNKEKTKAAHKTPIVGMIAAVVFAVILLFALVTWLSFTGNDPEKEAGVDAEDGVTTNVIEGTTESTGTEGTDTESTATESTGAEGAATD